MKNAKMKRVVSIKLMIYNLLCAGALLSLGLAPAADTGGVYWERQLRLLDKMNLPVEPILQLRKTSCGEAVITMAYKYVHPETKISEQQVIDFALANGYYTEDEAPFTSPADMAKIADHYAEFGLDRQDQNC